MHLSKIALALAATAAMQGCALITATPPSVDVLDVRLIGLGLTEQQLAFTLCVTNPNDDELAFRRVTTTVDISGSALAEGVSDLPIRLAPHSSTAVPFTVVTTVRNLGPQLLGIFRSQGIDYRVHGTVTLGGGLALTVPYSRSGRLDASQGLALADPTSGAPGTPRARCTLSPMQPPVAL